MVRNIEDVKDGLGGMSLDNVLVLARFVGCVSGGDNSLLHY